MKTKKLFLALVAVCAMGLTACGPDKIELSKSISSDKVSLSGEHSNIIEIEGDSVKIILTPFDKEEDEWLVNAVVSFKNIEKYKNLNLNTYEHSKKYEKYYEEEIDHIKQVYTDANGSVINDPKLRSDLQNKMTDAVKSKDYASFTTTITFLYEGLDAMEYKDALALYNKVAGIEIGNIAFRSYSTYQKSSSNIYDDAQDMYNKAVNDAEKMMEDAVEDAEKMMEDAVEDVYGW